MSTVSPVRTSTVSLQTRLGSTSPSRARTRKRPAPWMWNGWCIGWSESISLTSRIFTRSPTRNRQSIAWFAASVGAVDELPAHVRRRREPVDVDHVVFPLDAARVRVAVRRGRRGSSCSCSCVVLVLARARGSPACAPDEPRRQQLHAALRAAVGRLARDDLGVHRAGVAVGAACGDELHAAARAAARLLADDLGVHRADVDGGVPRVGLAHVHLGHERQRLVRLGASSSGVEPLALGRQLRVACAGPRTARPATARPRPSVDRDRAPAVGPLGRAVLQRELAGVLEQHVDDGPLRRRQHDVLDELLALDAAAVAADELHPRPGQRDLEHARVGGVGQVDSARPRPACAVSASSGSPATSSDVAEATHRRVRGLRAAERRDLAVLDAGRRRA